MPHLDSRIKSSERPSLLFVWVNLGVWLASASYSINQRIFGGFRTRYYNRGFADFVYKGQACVCLCAAAFAYLGYIGTKNGLKRSMIFVFIQTLLVMGASWLLFYLRAGVTFFDVLGNPVDTLRHIQWMNTRGNVIYILSLLTTADPTMVFKAQTYSFLCFLFGALGAVARTPFDEAFVTLSWVANVFQCRQIAHMTQKAVDGEIDNKVDTWTLRAARNITIGSFNYIGFSWWLVKIGAWSFSTGELHMAIGEFFAKVVFMLIVVNNSLEESQLKTVRDISVKTANLDEQMAASDRLLEKMIPAG
ncbi:hypothetical protein BC830DRAFT_815168 [Chytriomyces sp. MP71]|nr:hypothetical protein BC830DRAFT_815168 [Chytriomyces sp. MP71]